MTKSRLLSLLKKLVFIVFVLGCGETEQQGIINPKRNVINPQLADNKKTSKIIFKSNRDENDEIYAINLNGTNLIKSLIIQPEITIHLGRQMEIELFFLRIGMET
tara:strand:- start:277 stop:591 length:315 start_codon:yes stop_codon:yes gene_type:complete